MPIEAMQMSEYPKYQQMWTRFYMMTDPTSYRTTHLHWTKLVAVADNTPALS
jgi:hypothetical protein